MRGRWICTKIFNKQKLIYSLGIKVCKNGGFNVILWGSVSPAACRENFNVLVNTVFIFSDDAVILI